MNRLFGGKKAPAPTLEEAISNVIKKKYKIFKN